MKRTPRPVALLPEVVARKIAAGEVIDRPASVLRELLDNALDAGPSRIEVFLEQGGLGKLVVIDDGYGMTGEDLELVLLPHATSKIATPEDLEHLHTLGFRGEALPSIGACSKLEITTMREESLGGHRLSTNAGSEPLIIPHPANPGTSVSVTQLFHSLPARKRFLKNASAESRLCRQVFEEKALAFPGVSFRLSLDGKVRMDLPAKDHPDRVKEVRARNLEMGNFFEVNSSGEGWSLWGMGSVPGYVRKDRKYMDIYVNDRKIQEFSFVQAISYAYSGVLPGGFFPHAIVFLKVDPSLVDFNIHPAKREARFRIHGLLHKAIVAAYKGALDARDPYRRKYPGQQGDLPLAEDHNQPQISHQYDSTPLTEAKIQDKNQASISNSFTNMTSMQRVPLTTHSKPSAVEKKNFTHQISIKQNGQSSPTPNIADHEDFRYLGQIMGVFLLIEKENELWILDQHAGHERILFDRFKQGGPTQELLFPREIHPGENAQLLEDQIGFWSQRGIRITKGPDSFFLTGVPTSVSLMEMEVAAFLENQEGDEEDLEARLFASMSCKAAVKAGDPLDANAAISLIKECLSLPLARCPHGRPIWIRYSRDELYKAFGRIL